MIYLYDDVYMKVLPIIGMSPGNSYFKNKEIAHLLRETIKKYDQALVMVADVPATSTYEAMWYSPDRASRKARLQWNWLKNKTKTIIDTMGIDSSKVIIVDWAQEVE